MGIRFRERIFIDVMVFILGTAVYALLVSVASVNLGIIEFIAILTAVPLLCAVGADLVWRRHGFRSRMLVLSQRRLSHPIIALFAGIGVAVAAAGITLLLARVGQRTLPRNVRHQMLVLGNEEHQILVLAVVGAGATLVIWAILALADRIHVSAAHCHHVLNRIEREKLFGAYTFLEDAPAFEIRRESRILDFLARAPSSQNKGIVGKGRFARYSLRVEGDILPESSVANARQEIDHTAQAEPGTQLRSGSGARSLLAQAARQRQSNEYAARTKALADYANQLWNAGVKERRWYKRQGDTETQTRPEQLYFDKFFGNFFDKLFNQAAGFRAAGKDSPKFLTMVIKGPPGVGKTTLALQLTVTLAKRGNICLYYSLEEEREALIQAAIDFDWSAQAPPEKNDIAPNVEYKGVLHGAFEPIKRRIAEARVPTNMAAGAGAAGDVSHIGSDPRQAGLVGAVLVSSLGQHAMDVQGRLRQLYKEWDQLPDALPECVVIDSLEGFANVAQEGSERRHAIPRDQLLTIKNFFRDRCDVLVILVEDDGSGIPTHVDFVADVVIQLSRRGEDDNTLLFGEILKARNQGHAPGLHQIKIRSRLDLEAARAADVPDLTSLLSLSPGVQVIPSLDYRLFQARRQRIFDKHGLSSGFTGLDRMLASDRALGLRRKATSVLLGPSSTGKSLIAMNFLIEGVRNNNRALLLSVHDDEVTIRNRGVAQEPGRMKFGWATDSDQPYHTFTWDLDGIAQWCEAQRGATERRLRLPYLFRAGSVSFEEQDQYLGEADAVWTFLKRLAAACPQRGGQSQIRWDETARARLLDAYNEAWQDFESTMGPFLEVTENPKLPGTALPKRVELLYAPAGGDLPPPCLSWDSRRWDAERKVVDYDTRLFKTLYLRPGNLTPGEFIDILTREIGEPSEPSTYGRVVFDDVDQLRQRLPVLARSSLFLPAMIDICKATGITSLFVGGPGEGPEQESSLGLAIMADHVIRTSVAFGNASVSRTNFTSPPGAAIEEFDGDVSSESSDAEHRDRIILVEIAARPGSKQLRPHQLHVALPPDDQVESRV